MPVTWRSIELCTPVAVAVVALGLAPTTFADGAGTNPPVFMMTWDASNDQVEPYTYDPFDFGTREWGTWTLGGGPNGEGGTPRTRTGWRYIGDRSDFAWTLGWDCVVNEDPYVDATINVTNNSASEQVFWVYMPLNIVPSIPGQTLMTSYVSAVVSDQTFDFAVFDTDGVNPVFQGYIDGTALGAEAQLWQPGYSLTAGPFGSANDDETLADQLGPGANNQIALRLQFRLSPGDSASVTGTFEVQPVPGPAVLSLFAVVAALGSRRRRA